MQPADQKGQRKKEQGRRHQIGHEDPPADRVRAAVAEPGQRIAGQNAAQQRDQGRDDRHHRRVQGPAAEVGPREEMAVMFERRLDHEERTLVEVEQLGGGFERRDQHPVERKECDEEEEQDRDVEPHPPAEDGIANLMPAPPPGRSSNPAPGHPGCGQRRPALDRHQSCRCRAISTPAITMERTGKRTREMAAPIPMAPP